MKAKIVLIFLCIFLYKEATSAAINGESKIDFTNLINFIAEKFPVLYKLSVENSIPVLNATISDLKIFLYTPQAEEIIVRTTEITDFMKEVELAEKPLNFEKHYNLIQMWRDLIRKFDDFSLTSLVFCQFLKKNGLESVLIDFGNSYKSFGEEFNTKLNELWHALTETQKAENLKFTEWYHQYEKLDEQEQFEMWGKLFVILKTNT